MIGEGRLAIASLFATTRHHREHQRRLRLAFARHEHRVALAALGIDRAAHEHLVRAHREARARPPEAAFVAGSEIALVIVHVAVHADATEHALLHLFPADLTRHGGGRSERGLGRRRRQRRLGVQQEIRHQLRFVVRELQIRHRGAGAQRGGIFDPRDHEIARHPIAREAEVRREARGQPGRAQIVGGLASVEVAEGVAGHAAAGEEELATTREAFVGGPRGGGRAVGRVGIGDGRRGGEETHDGAPVVLAEPQTRHRLLHRGAQIRRLLQEGVDPRGLEAPRDLREIPRLLVVIDVVLVAADDLFAVARGQEIEVPIAGPHRLQPLMAARAVIGAPGRRHVLGFAFGADRVAAVALVPLERGAPVRERARALRVVPGHSVAREDRLHVRRRRHDRLGRRLVTTTRHEHAREENEENES